MIQAQKHPNWLKIHLKLKKYPKFLKKTELLLESYPTEYFKIAKKAPRSTKILPTQKAEVSIG
jgi:hypothetical protein